MPNIAHECRSTDGMPRFWRRGHNPPSARNFRRPAAEGKPLVAPRSHAARFGRGEGNKIGLWSLELLAGQSDHLPTSQEMQCLRSMLPFRSSEPSQKIIQEIPNQPTIGWTLEESP